MPQRFGRAARSAETEKEAAGFVALMAMEKRKQKLATEALGSAN
jgi:hypothetical protein